MLLWPALDYLIKLFFHHEQTFFHPSTYPTPWVAGEILSSPAASRWRWVAPWTSHQFYHREKSSHPYSYEVTTWFQVHVFVLCVEAGVPGGKSQWHRGITQTHRTNTQIPLTWSISVCSLTHNLLVLKQQHEDFAPLDGSDSIGLIMTATSASVLSNIRGHTWTTLQNSSSETGNFWFDSFTVLFSLLQSKFGKCLRQKLLNVPHTLKWMSVSMKVKISPDSTTLPFPALKFT